MALICRRLTALILPGLGTETAGPRLERLGRGYCSAAMTKFRINLSPLLRRRSALCASFGGKRREILLASLECGHFFARSALEIHREPHRPHNQADHA